MKRLILFACVLTLVLGGAGIASAATILASGTWGGSGHTYAVIDHGSFVNWNTAGADLPSGFFLGTITSQGEQDFIDSLFASTGVEFVWLGGFQDTGARTSSDDWNWVTGEDFYQYQNWFGGEPNDFPTPGENDEENYLSMHGHTGNWFWNDTAINQRYSVAETPIPGTAMLLISGLVGLIGIHRVRRS
jgi:hypothetical protein